MHSIKLIQSVFVLLFMISIVIVGCSMARQKKADQLKEYRAKRNLKKSGEPSGSKKIKSHKNHPVFVIHKHAASHLHYDLRLEIHGALVSWAIPKGPSLNPAEKRLAIMTEDHPMDYLDFEGIIPEGNYGAGTVMVWDIGTFYNIKHHNGKLVPLDECLENGHLEIFLEGKKLQGAFSLIRFKGEEKQWLFIKMDDEYADARRNPVSSQQKSALTGRTMNQITKDGERE